MWKCEKELYHMLFSYVNEMLYLEVLFYFIFSYSLCASCAFVKCVGEVGLVLVFSKAADSEDQGQSPPWVK